jgi:hypothetical protein
MIATSVIPGIALTVARFETDNAVALIVGERHNIVGSAPGTSMSIANRFAPVTISSASILGCGLPTRLNCDRGFRRAWTIVVFDTAPRLASSPNVADRPSGAVITPSLIVRSEAACPRTYAAVFASCPRAVAAAVRTGVKIECIEFDPPVSWFHTSSGRASAKVTLTLSSGMPISSAIVIATAVVIPCPTSARGSANETVPSVLTTTVINPDVGIVASVSRSVRSYASTGWMVGTAASADAINSCAPATTVGAAIRYPRNRLRDSPSLGSASDGDVPGSCVRPRSERGRAVRAIVVLPHPF